MNRNRANTISCAVMILLGPVLKIACSSEKGPSQLRSPIGRDPSTTSSQSPPPDLGDPVQTEPGSVNVTLSGAPYKEGALVYASIANGLGRTIYAEDFKSDCSIATLERWESDHWAPLLGCNMGRAPLVLAIGTGRARAVQIDPQSVHFNVIPGSGTVGFGAGRYRLRFTYRFEPGREDEETTHSEPFRVER